MPQESVTRYTCALTGVVGYGSDLPPGWFVIEGEVFSPDAQVPLAQYVVDHPTIGFKALMESLKARPAAAAKAIHAGGALPKG